MEYTVQDIIDAAVESEPTKVQAAFDHIVGQKVMDALEIRKRELATSIYNASQEAESETDLEQQQTEDDDGEEDTTSSEEEANQPAQG